MQEESRMKLHSETKGDVRMRSTLVITNSCITGIQGESHKYYNFREVGHLSKICPKLPKKIETYGYG
jgi:hypothetical protein